MKRASLAILIAFLVLTVAASAQTPPMPKPGPELKKLDYFAGTWTTTGDVKPGPMGPGGKMSGTSHAKWMDGGYFMEMHSDMKGPMGNGSGVAFMGYNADEKKYTYNEFNSMGEAEAAKGTVDGDAWTWTDENMMGGQMMHGRYSMKVMSPTSYTFKYEMSQDGSTWTTVMDGMATKK